MTRTDFEVVTPAGVTILTSSDLELAKNYARDRANQIPGLRVEIVETTVTRRRAYAPRVLARVA